MLIATGRWPVVQFLRINERGVSKYVTLVNSRSWRVFRGDFTILGQRVDPPTFFWYSRDKLYWQSATGAGHARSEFRGLFGEETRVFLTIGVLGSFTTMSTFSYESMKLLEQGEHMLFGLNLAGSITLCLLAVYLGTVLITVMGLK